MPLWGKTDAEASRPNWINLDNYPAGTELVFVDAVEAQQPENKAKGLNAPGWWLYRTYTDSNGSTRYNNECLVAVADRASVGDDVANDDDAIVVDTTLVITEHPQNQSVDGVASANFAVDFAETDVTVGIQWQVSTDAGSTWTDITGETGFDLDVAAADPEYVDGNQFRAILSADGATDVVSDAATLTVTV